MAAYLPEPSPAPIHDIHSFLSHDTDDDDADTASQRSISLSSPGESPRHSMLNDYAAERSFGESYSKRGSHPYTVDTELESEDNSSMFSHSIEHGDTPDSSAAPSVYEEPKGYDNNPLPTYPPTMQSRDDRSSVSSIASGSSRKTRPESLLVNLPNGPIIYGVALVDFNHLIGPRIEYSQGEIFDDEEVAKILPFLALPDGAHLSAEDYSYFHLVPSGPNPTTIFGISCNQQIASSALLVKMPDVTRSTVQKAVVVLASKPVFGPIRAKLGVVTTALFNQRDFTDASILDDFASSLESSLRGQLTESGLYMGLLQTLDDCGSPLLAARAPTLSRPSSLKTSDSKSMMAFMGLPLDIFGKESFFQPYLPLQQLDVLKETRSWLCGSTNSIVTQQKEVDLFINVETGIFEFRNPQLERSAALTAADRKWMDDIITDVNEGWDEENPTPALQTRSLLGAFRFKGSDDYLRTKFEEYVSAALSTVKYQDFVSKSAGGGVMITGGSGGDATSVEDFNPLWISEFKKTNAYEVWDKITDPLIFDIVEPRHPCNEKPSVVADIGLRLQEGYQELKLEQQLAPAREAVTRAVTVGSTNFFKAVEGVRDRWAQRSEVASSTGNSRSSTPVEVSKADLDGTDAPTLAPPSTTPAQNGLRPFSLLARRASSDSSAPSTPAQSPTPSSILPASLASPSKNLAAWSAGIGSFISTRAPTFLARRPSEDTGATTQSPPTSDKPVPAPPPEPVAKARTVPPPVHVQAVEIEDEDEDEDGHGINNGPLTPQPFKGPSINVTTPGGGGTTPTRRAFKLSAGPPTPSVPAGPPTPRAAATPMTAPIPPREPEPESEPEPPPAPAPRARPLARSNTTSRRPTGGLWEEHSDVVLDKVPKGTNVTSPSHNPWEDDEDLAKVTAKSRGSDVKDDASSTYSKASNDEDLEDAYSGMAL
ncbi:hypothetical protein DXG01_008052 [Tephrocybe rancida]|nr:hypothetical protein DXG01_008052 [Tephrocybe rancida]